jgi:hypothetical protein
MFTSHYARGTNGTCGCKMDVKSTWTDSYMTSNGSCFTVVWIVFQKPLYGAHPSDPDLKCCYYCQEKSKIMRARSHMASHNPRMSVTTLHDFEGILGQPLDTFFRALT